MKFTILPYYYSTPFQIPLPQAQIVLAVIIS